MAELILSVYFDGTDGRVEHDNSLTSLFYNNTITDNVKTFKLCFNGCGTDNPYSTSFDFGGIFTYGLMKQVEAAVKQVKNLLSANENDNTLTVNMYGFSRGGAATFLLTKHLNNLPHGMLERLTINLVALEPVPGNLIKQVGFDVVGHTLTSHVWDLSNCKINKMLVLYTNQLLPDFGNSLMKIVADAHAPILPNYPESCEGTIDVLYGCHKSAQWLNISSQNVTFDDPSAFLAFCRIKSFLNECGTTFDFSQYNYSLECWKKIKISGQNRSIKCDDKIEDSPSCQIELYKEILQKLKCSSGADVQRPMHKGNSIITALGSNTEYLNAHHKQLVHGGKRPANDNSDIAMFVQDIRPELEMTSCSIS